MNADLDYVLARIPGGDVYILAKGRLEEFGKAAGIDSFEILAELKGSEFEFMTASHPLYDRESIILNGDHVTLEAGTGCVHTAPGHGQEDYEICRKYNAAGKTDIPILVPVDDRGIMTEEAGPFAGQHYSKANVTIADALRACGALVASETISHQYAHCWRCKEPILYRATDQWFCSVDAFKEQAVDACDKVTWMPDWGHDRMVSMVRERADWCISRQRIGVSHSRLLLLRLRQARLHRGDDRGSLRRVCGAGLQRLVRTRARRFCPRALPAPTAAAGTSPGRPTPWTAV
jgi:isoleucyl-tRNA synthetase